MREHKEHRSQQIQNKIRINEYFEWERKMKNQKFDEKEIEVNKRLEKIKSDNNQRYMEKLIKREEMIQKIKIINGMRRDRENEELKRWRMERDKRLEEFEEMKRQNKQRNENNKDCAMKRNFRKAFDSVVKVNYKEKFIIDED